MATDISPSNVRGATGHKRSSKRKANPRKPGRRKRNRKLYRSSERGVHDNSQPRKDTDILSLGDRPRSELDNVGRREQTKCVRLKESELDERRDIPKVQRAKRKTYTLHNVEVMGLTRDKIEVLWNKVVELGLTDVYKGSYDIFCKQLFDPTTVILEVVPMQAIYYMTGVTPNGNADVTLVVFERKLLGQRELYLQMIQRMMLDFNLCRVTAMIPDWNTIAQNLARRIGFTLEGVLRKWGRSNGAPNDVLIFGLLREELITPESRVH